jgi:hypothetical protein
MNYQIDEICRETTTTLAYATPADAAKSPQASENHASLGVILQP